MPRFKKGIKKTKKVPADTIAVKKRKQKIDPMLRVNQAKAAREELLAEEAKFSCPRTALHTGPDLRPFLPNRYDKDTFILQVRDPWWIHAYWEVRGQTLERFKELLKDDFYKAKRTLRVYDVSQIIFDGRNAHRFFDIAINEQVDNWYIDVGAAGRSWCVDLGLKLADGRFITILRSNTVHTPLDGPSGVIDEEWTVPDDMFSRLYGMSFGLGQSSPRGKAWQERMKKALFSGILSSPRASPVKRIPKAKKFWLTVDCELIVYGATEPDAKVTVQARPIRLRQDGTFTLRFVLPDGKQVMPIKAVSSDRKEKRTITPIITRDTKFD